MSCTKFSDSVLALTDETDYTPLNPDTQGVEVFHASLFNNATRRNCNNVTITNDILVEGSEEFSLLLHELPFIPLPLSTLLYANSATITILDQDGKMKVFDQLIVCMLLLFGSRGCNWIPSDQLFCY